MPTDPDGPLRRFGFTRNPAAWTAAGLCSAALLALVVGQVDWGRFVAMLARTAPAFVLLAVVLFVLEGVFASLRLRQFAMRPGGAAPGYGRAYAANAWYVLGVGLLPARMGEAVGVVAMHRMLGVRGGAAVMAIAAQRLMDLAVLAGAVLPVVIVSALVTAFGERIGTPATIAVGASGLAVLAATVYLLARPEDVLTPLARLVQRWRRSGRAGRAVARIVLQARLWSRHLYRRVDRPRAVGSTVGKWVVNLLGLVVLMAAFGLALDGGLLLLMAVLYSFLMAIPIPTVGGLGLSEAGLTGLLALAGVAVPEAAALSLMVRAVLILFPFLYGALTWAALTVARHRANAAEARAP